jgi:hypothetical protein
MYFFSYARLSCILLTVLSSKICPVSSTPSSSSLSSSSSFKYWNCLLLLFSLLPLVILLYTLSASHHFGCLPSSYLLVVRLPSVCSPVCFPHFLLSSFQCGGSGMVIPDPTFFHPGSRIQTVSNPDPGSRILIKEFKYFNPKKSQKMVSKL